MPHTMAPVGIGFTWDNKDQGGNGNEEYVIVAVDGEEAQVDAQLISIDGGCIYGRKIVALGLLWGELLHDI